MPKVLVIIPAFNEEGAIEPVIQDLRRLSLPLTILVVDDGSRDLTAERARKAGAQVISLPFNVGIGAAVQTGFLFALSKDFDVAVQVDGDGQHDVSFLETLLKPLHSGQSDMVIGSRFLPPYLGYRSSLVRRLGITFFARLISILTGYPVTDPTSGFRAYNKKGIRLFARYYPYDFPEPEAIMVARRQKLKVMEVPVHMRKRLQGQSSIRYLCTLYYMLKVTCAIMLQAFKEEEIIHDR